MKQRTEKADNNKYFIYTIRKDRGNRMARKKKPETLEEQLEKVNIDIEAMKEKLSKLKKRKKDLEEKIKLNRLTELDNLLSSKGKTVEDVKDMLRE